VVERTREHCGDHRHVCTRYCPLLSSTLSHRTASRVKCVSPLGTARLFCRQHEGSCCLRIGNLEKLSVHVRKVRRVVLGGGAANTALVPEKCLKECGSPFRVERAARVVSARVRRPPLHVRRPNRAQRVPVTARCLARPHALQPRARAAPRVVSPGEASSGGSAMHTNMQRDLLQGPRAPRLAPCAAQPRALPRVHTLHRFGSARASSTRINAQHPMSQGRPPKACSLFLLCVSLPTARR
jgi:hypothetical protein